MIQPIWLWRWLPHRLSKRLSLSTATVLFGSTFTRTIITILLTKWFLGSNLSQKNYFPTKENIFYPTPKGEEKCDVACFAISVCFEAATNRIFRMQDLLYLKAWIRDLNHNRAGFGIESMHGMRGAGLKVCTGSEIRDWKYAREAGCRKKPSGWRD